MTKYPIPDAIFEQHSAWLATSGAGKTTIVAKPIVILGRADATVQATQAEKAYAAGFFDDEGCVTIAINKNVASARGPIFNMRVSASQNETAPLLFLRNRWGGSVAKCSRKTAAYKQTYHWSCFARRAAVFIKDVLPFCIVKRDRLLLALEFQESVFNPGAGGHTEEYRKQRHAFHAQMAALNSHQPLRAAE